MCWTDYSFFFLSEILLYTQYLSLLFLLFTGDLFYLKNLSSLIECGMRGYNASKWALTRTGCAHNANSAFFCYANHIVKVSYIRNTTKITAAPKKLRIFNLYNYYIALQQFRAGFVKTWALLCAREHWMNWELARIFNEISNLSRCGMDLNCPVTLTTNFTEHFLSGWLGDLVSNGSKCNRKYQIFVNSQFRSHTSFAMARLK